ncbi:hypothetical protein DFH06DRAFT_1131873 [Mycena polygramma]|nr:hypothetical protein DFH06DRAFT_1131873 [Mycena polygramma]
MNPRAGLQSKATFVLNRYLTEAITACVVYLFSGTATSWNTAVSNFHLGLRDNNYNCFRNSTLPSVVVVIRVYALWDGRKSVARILTAAFTVCISGATILGIFASIQFQRSTDYFEPLHVCMFGDKPKVVIATLGVMSLFDFFLVLLVVCNSMDRPRTKHAEIVSGLQQDGAGLFLTAEIILAVTTVLAFCTIINTRLHMRLEGIALSTSWPKGGVIMMGDMHCPLQSTSQSPGTADVIFSCQPRVSPSDTIKTLFGAAWVDFAEKTSGENGVLDVSENLRLRLETKSARAWITTLPNPHTRRKYIPPLRAFPSSSLFIAWATMKRLFHRISSHNLKHSAQQSDSTDHDTHPLPPLPTATTLTTTVMVTAEEKMWRTVNDSNGNVPKSEKFLNKMVDEAITASNASNNVVATIKTIAANEEVQQIGKAILSGVPALMNALEGLSKVHPFAAAAFLPFQFAYKQAMKQHDNEKYDAFFSCASGSGAYLAGRTRMSLFEAIKDVMLVIVEMKGVDVKQDDKRVMPDGQPLVTRLSALGQQMKKDIEGCYNALDAMSKQSFVVKFCKAGGWSNTLASFKVTFKTRREELHFALTLNTATTIQDMSVMLKEMHASFAKEFQASKTPQDRIIDAFFKANGGEEAVMADDAKLKKLMALQGELTVTHTIQSAYAAGSKKRPGESGAQNTDMVALRKEYRAAVESVIQENMEGFVKRMDLSLHLLGEDLKKDIHREGDRIINFLNGGPYLRLTDKIMRQVWKDQGWRGSVKTRSLVLALRDYMVERAAHAESGSLTASPASPVVQERDDVQDPETAMGVPLPDEWILDYLQVKRLRCLQRRISSFGVCVDDLLVDYLEVLDPDASGFSTIAEVNAFTESRQDGWSLPRWISYWAIGWQIYATRYCTEIDEIFTQMLLLRDQVAARMPGNKRYINNYIEETWPIVVGLTSGLERFEGTEWLANQFKDYVDAQEASFQSSLARIHYDIDTPDTVNEILRGEPIERSIFIILAVILRRHLAKMHLCLTSDMNEEELFDDRVTVKFVIEAAWLRYNDLLEFYKHQQVIDMKQSFDWFSCGLFKSLVVDMLLLADYFAWNDWTSEAHYRKTEIISYSAEPTIREVKDKDLTGILIHDDSISFLSMEPDHPTKGHFQSLQQPTAAPTSGVKPSTIEDILSGVWYGFHVDDGDPYTGMFHVKISASMQPGRTELVIEGQASSFGPIPTIVPIEGNATPTTDGKFKVELQQEGYTYHGTFDLDLLTISGRCEAASNDYDGKFILKKTPVASVMCHRPLFPRRLTARELWKFAYDAVIGDLHRRKPSIMYLYTRMKMVKRCLELLHSNDRPGEPLELSGLKKAFTVQEYFEIRLLADWYDRVADVQPILCLQCESPLGPGYNVEFDADEDCVSCATLPDREDLPTPHLPTHLRLKTRDMLLVTDYPSVKKRAMDCVLFATQSFSRAKATARPDAALDGGKSLLQITDSVTVSINATIEAHSQTLPTPPPLVASDDSAESDGSADGSASDDSDSTESEEEYITLNCLICHQRVSTPCWYCVDCSQKDAFVCVACETTVDDLFPWDFLSRYRKEVDYRPESSESRKPLILNSSAHSVLHVLIRFTNEEGATPKGNSVDLSLGPRDMALREIEQRLLSRMDHQDKAELEQRLSRIEALLQALVKDR